MKRKLKKLNIEKRNKLNDEVRALDATIEKNLMNYLQLNSRDPKVIGYEIHENFFGMKS